MGGKITNSCAMFPSFKGTFCSYLKPSCLSELIMFDPPAVFFPFVASFESQSSRAPRVRLQAFSFN